MKKIIVAFDAEHSSKGVIEFAIRLNEAEPILLIGVFMPQVDFATSATDPFVPLMEHFDPETLEEQVRLFEETCTHNHIEFRVHKDPYDLAIPNLRKETRYADLLILGSEKFYRNLGTESPNEYLKLILHDAECPIVLVPEKFSFPESNILSYDGSDDAVFAIKSFSCLFPQLCDNKTVLVYARQHPTEIPDMDNIKELAARHFSDLTLQMLDVDPKKYFSTWINDIEHPILISGSYSRSAVSQIFKKSFITEIINEHKIPVFIAHR